MSVSTSSKKLNKGKYYLSTGYKPSQIGFIPVDWHVKKIADISEDIFAGATPSTSISEYWNGDIPWMSSGEINKKIIWETEKYITEKGFNSSSTKMVPENSVLIALYYHLLIQKIPNTGYNRHFKFLKEMVFKRPTIEEQKAISNVLSSLDLNIDLLKQEVSFLRQQKKGLMQLLLTGKVRVKC